MQPYKTKLLAAAAVLVLGSAAPAHAGIWTAVATGVTADISAIDYRPDALRIGTTNGRILRRTDSGFVQEASFTGRRITALQMSPDGQTGLAGTDNGRLFRYTNGSWSAVSLLGTTFPYATCQPTPGTPVPRLSAPTAEITAIAWSSARVAWAATAAQGQLLASTDGGSTWQDVSRQSDQTCRLPATITDVLPIAGSEQDLFFVDTDRASLWRTKDALATPAEQRIQLSECSAPYFRAALDPADPRRVEAVGPCDGRNSGYTEDAGATRDFTATSEARPQDVAAQAGVFLLVGDGGKIEQTRDGRSIVPQPADAPLARTPWKTVDFADATHAAVGGAGGALVVSDQAGAVPDTTPPTVTIAGKARVAFGVPARFRAVAQDLGGAGVDPHGFSWSSPGLPSTGSGANQTYTFPAPGSYSVGVVAHDRAGNASTAVVYTVLALRRTLVKPHARVSAHARGRRKRRVVIVRISGGYGAPAGLGAAQACSGPLTLRLFGAGRLLASADAGLGPSCRFSHSFRLRYSRVRRLARLRVSVIFGGNAAVNPMTRRYPVALRR